MKARENAGAARLAFQGTVVAVDGRRATVRVDRPPTPPTVNLSPGRTVEVRLAPREHVSPGDTVVFEIGGWEVGQSVVLDSLGHLQPPAADHAARGAVKAAPAPRADLVVSGTVTRVGPAPVPARSYVTEHDPKWHDAVVKVTGTLEGELPGNEVVVRFPASDDVAFHDAPKLALGQTGTFLLKREATKSGTPIFKAIAVRPNDGTRPPAPAPSRRSRTPRRSR